MQGIRLAALGLQRRRRRPVAELALHIGGEQVGRHLEVRRAAGRGQDRRSERRELLGRLDHRDHPRHRREHLRLPAGLVQHAAIHPRATQRRRDVGRDHEDRRPRRPRLADGAERVRRARARRRQRDAELPARARVAVGRVRRRLLVADADQPDRRLAQRLPERQVVNAREAEADLHAGVLELRDDDLGAGGHPRIRHASRIAGIPCAMSLDDHRSTTFARSPQGRRDDPAGDDLRDEPGGQAQDRAGASQQLRAAPAPLNAAPTLTQLCQGLATLASRWTL